MNDKILDQLVLIIRKRRSSDVETSYTKSLLDAGVGKCAKKLGEEATETVIAALSEDDEALRNEAADLIFHLLVLLESREIELNDVLNVLDSRMGISGHEEKASRTK